MIKVCFDTSIFISAFIFSGKPAFIFDLAVDKKIELVTSLGILAEVARVLKQKFGWDQRDIKKQLKVIVSISEIVTPKTNIRVIKYLPDNLILETAIEGGVDYIVTGDKKHLLTLKNFRNIPVLAPAEFLKLFPKII